MVELASHILKMNDAEMAAWLRKAVHDCLNGCSDQDCDPFIKVQYDNTMNGTKSKQEYDARRYQHQKLLRSGKPNTISTNDAAEVTTPSAGGSCTNLLATTSLSTKISTKTGNEGGDIRENSLNDRNSDAPKGVSTAGEQLESATPSLLPFTTVTTTQKTLAGAVSPEGKEKNSTPVSLAGKSPASTPAVKKPYGTCGHVMLSDEEGRHLREVYGENLRIAIDILDAYIENNGKAAKKYKNHAAVLRKGNWVYEKVQTMALNEKRIENAAHQCDRRSFAQKDRDDRSNWLTTSIFENEAANG